MNKHKVIITGANGYLGRYFLSYFKAKGWEIVAFVHNDPEDEIENVLYLKYSLLNALDSENFVGVDCVIHAAYVRFDKNKDADKINIEGTQGLITMCESKNIPILFLSSFSAHKQAISHYGMAKLKCETLFDLKKHTILKIGFIIGHGGILGEMMTRMQSSKIFPLVGGNQPMQTIYINDLCHVIYLVISNNLKGTYNVAHENIVSMRSFYKTLATLLKVDIKFIPIPMNLLYIGCRFFEAFGIRIPVSSESVQGLKRMVSFKTKEDQKLLNINFLDCETSLRKIIES